VGLVGLCKSLPTQDILHFCDSMSVFACTFFVSILHPADHSLLLSRCQHLPVLIADAFGERFHVKTIFLSAYVYLGQGASHLFCCGQIYMSL